ncbi:MAG TPA: SUMF1/EgtB/PvdO family nonheme iron enzyme [Candidatus Binatia bacterium]|jgi:formylglycine-generating enzyme required for sulfatase activity|nr:SUMF1/EgtB/PvdO family nonheme iron enzyme [Candidatus Binatia bacterium]
MMKLYSLCALATGSLLALVPDLSRAAMAPESFIYETPREFFGSGDFDGDGRLDLVIVDKESGKYRIGYGSGGGMFSWVDCRPSGLKGISGVSIGKLFATNLDGLAFASPDATELTLVEAASTTATGKPLVVPFTAAMGPNTLVAAAAGGPGGTRLADLYIASIYNSPDANLATLLRNNGTDFPKLSEAALSAPEVKANRLALKTGQPELVCSVLHDDKGDIFRAEDLSSGKPVTIATASGLPAGVDYAAGNFGGSPLLEFVFYKPGENKLVVRPVEEAAPGQFRFGKGDTFDLGQPVRRVITIHHATGEKLLVIFGQGETAGVFNFDGVKAPAPVQTISGTNDLFTCAAGLGDGFITFLQPASGKFSTRYRVYNASGAGFVAGAFGSLPSLADNDNITIPDIYQRITANLTVKNEAEMKPFTNTIPGTRVSYAMVPIPAGEFVMGSPASEANHNADEAPQHKVSISPFWMGRCEVTWNEYELFMYPDEEHRTRMTIPTDAAADKLADAVSHPSKPYVEMSFGMGKDGYPAIAMTQHGANKYCQWLSAKTGQFYRLPTEAEWEYACRAGTTTAYFFGDDPSKLGEYAWYEENSDFKYQKVGKKKPNPWGLYDMCGNVVEWVLDQYDPNYYQQCAGTSPILDPWNKATKPYPHSVRGGSWDDPAPKCRSAARRGSDRTWKMQDPQLPKSIWYFSDAQWVGFRIVRPLKVPTAEQMQKYWSSGVERD